MKVLTRTGLGRLGVGGADAPGVGGADAPGVGGADAAGPPGARRASGSLPLPPGTREEVATLEALMAAAKAGGLPGARLHGFVGDARPHAPELLHALLGLGALGWATAVGDAGSWALGLLLLSAGARCLGWKGVGALVPRSACFNLVLCGAGTATRRVVVGALDRTRALPALRWAVLACVGVAILARMLGPEAQMVAAAGLILAAVAAWWVGRPARPAADAPESLVASAVLAEALAEAKSGDTEVAVLLSGCASERGAGYMAFFDWWGLSPEAVELVIVEAPGAAEGPGTAFAALTAARWRVSRRIAGRPA